jgi:YebC/PmpR family DNA-binding regulatory protein
MGRKWQNIKLDKGKTDAQRGALFTRLSREITLCVKSGSPDPESNHRLKIAIDKAREHNMPSDNVKRAIARGAGGTGEKEIEEIRYEGYGPHGVAVVFDAATDNRNRTAGELRFMFSKHGGALGETGSVGWMFDAVGIVEVDPQGASEDALTEAALVEGVVDLEYSPTRAYIYTEPTQLAAAREALRAVGLKIVDLYLGMRAKQTVAPEGPDLSAALAFLDVLEEHEDVQHVFSNLDVSEAALEALT